jgi:hypothetical protein
MFAQGTQRKVCGLIATIAGLVIAFTATSWFRQTYFWVGGAAWCRGGDCWQTGSCLGGHSILPLVIAVMVVFVGW